LHPALGPTTFWGYHPALPLGGGMQLQKHLGGIIVAQKGVPIQITFTNNLPNEHIIPVDTSIEGADLAQNPRASNEPPASARFRQVICRLDKSQFKR
jgi:spore coat protein A, manganese oxidase